MIRKDIKNVMIYGKFNIESVTQDEYWIPISNDIVNGILPVYLVSSYGRLYYWI